MARQNADTAVVATQTTAIATALLGGAAVAMLLGVIVSRQPAGLNTPWAPIAFALTSTILAGGLVWLQSRRTLSALDDLEDARARGRSRAASAAAARRDEIKSIEDEPSVVPSGPPGHLPQEETRPAPLSLSSPALGELEAKRTGEVVQDAPATVFTPPPIHQRALVCESDVQLCTVLEALLRAQGAQADVVHDIPAAAAALLTQRYDVILLDLQLAGGDGLDVLRTLPSPQRGPLQQVILLSRDASRQIDRDDFPVAIADVIEKPVRLDQLRRSLQLALAQASTARDDARPTILHVDDDPDIRRLVRDLLAPLGEVITVATLFEAKRKLSTVDPDLVVLDIGLRDGSGLELMPLLTRTTGQRTPAIVFSGRTTEASRGEGGVKVFAKSCASFEALVVEARRLVGRDAGALRAEAA